MTFTIETKYGNSKPFSYEVQDTSTFDMNDFEKSDKQNEYCCKALFLSKDYSKWLKECKNYRNTLSLDVNALRNGEISYDVSFIVNGKVIKMYKTISEMEGLNK